MTSTLFIKDKATGLFVGSVQQDGRGRGGFDSGFFEKIGDNPNTQLNFRLKPEFESIRVATNLDAFTDRKNPANQARLINEHFAKIASYEQSIITDAPKFAAIQAQRNNSNPVTVNDFPKETVNPTSNMKTSFNSTESMESKTPMLLVLAALALVGLVFL